MNLTRKYTILGMVFLVAIFLATVNFAYGAPVYESGTHNYPTPFPTIDYYEVGQQRSRDYIAEHGSLPEPKEYINFSLDMPEKVICGWIPVNGRVPTNGITVITLWRVDGDDVYMKYWNLNSDSSKELRGYMDIPCEWPEGTYDLKYHWMGKTNLQVTDEGLTRPHLDIEQKLTVYHP